MMPIVVLLLICVVVTGALALMNNVTAPIIEAAAAERAFVAMNEMLPQASGFVPVVDEVFPRTIRAVYQTENNVGYIFIVSVNGFSGEIRVMCAIDHDGRLVGSTALSHSETQGIGTVVDMESFTGQFVGAYSGLEGVYAVTGATISSRAYMDAVREAFVAFDLVRG